MPDICDLILDDHAMLRRRFAELDELHGERSDQDACDRRWRPVADLLEVHAAAEEALFYPRLLEEGSEGDPETTDAIKDHNDIRDAVRDATVHRPGSEEWWDAVRRAREENSDHMGEEERGAIADFREHADADERRSLGDEWVRFQAEHAGARGIDPGDRDPERYVAEHR